MKNFKALDAIQRIVSTMSPSSVRPEYRAMYTPAAAPRAPASDGEDPDPLAAEVEQANQEWLAMKAEQDKARVAVALTTKGKVGGRVVHWGTNRIYAMPFEHPGDEHLNWGLVVTPGNHLPWETKAYETARFYGPYALVEELLSFVGLDKDSDQVEIANAAVDALEEALVPGDDAFKVLEGLLADLSDLYLTRHNEAGAD